MKKLSIKQKIILWFTIALLVIITLTESTDIFRIQGKEFPKPQNCSERLMKIIAKACRAKPSERYASISRMYDALENFLDDC